MEEDLQEGLRGASGPPDVSDEPQEGLHEDEKEEPKTRAQFLQYSCEITLDPDTANPRLLLSEGNRKATKVDEDVDYPIHPDRFMDAAQVMSTESLTGRHYFEVERSGGPISVGVSYKDISRTGTEATFGFNEKSWALDCLDARFMVRHVYITAAKPHPVSSRVGVYLDHRAGTLSFYNISETVTLLHTVQTTFTEPLYVGLWVHGHRAAAVMSCKHQVDCVDYKMSD